jgi:uncharacterized protein YjiS (DUF1127 family)
MSTHDIPVEGLAHSDFNHENLLTTSKSTLAALGYAIWRPIAALILYRAFRAAEASLMKLDDRLLKDIGLDRSEIRSALRIAWQKRPNTVTCADRPFQVVSLSVVSAERRGDHSHPAQGQSNARRS